MNIFFYFLQPCTKKDWIQKEILVFRSLLEYIFQVLQGHLLMILQGKTAFL